MTTTTDNDNADDTPEQRFGRLIRQRRLEANISQEGLAQHLRNQGIPLVQVMVSRIEAGTRPVRLDEAAALCRALGIDPVDAMAGAMRATGRPESLTERAAYLELVGAEQGLTTVVDMLAQLPALVRDELGKTTNVLERWELAAKSMARPPRRDVTTLRKTIRTAQKLLGQDNTK